MNLTPEQIAEIGDAIRYQVIDYMIAKTSMGTRESWNTVINSGEFPSITEYYNEQVNAICDAMKEES